MKIDFEIPTKPAGQPRARVGVIGGHGRAFKSKRAHTLEADVLAFATPVAPDVRIEGAVSVTVEARIAVPDSWPDWRREAALAGAIRPTSRPDADNVAKLILDAINRSGRFWRDDAQVVELRARKVYASSPATRVTIAGVEEVEGAVAWRAIKARRLGEVVRSVLDAPAAPSAPTLLGGPS